MTVEKADEQAKELIKLIKDSKIKNIKVGSMNIIDIDKFLDIHECRLSFLPTLSRDWKTHYFRLYIIKKNLHLSQKYNEK